VCHHDYRLPETVAQVAEDVLYFPAVGGVKTPRRLIGEYYFRIIDQGAGDRRALTFSAAHRRRFVVQAFSKPELLQQFLSLFHRFPFAHAGYQRRQRHIFLSGEFRQ